MELAIALAKAKGGNADPEKILLQLALNASEEAAEKEKKPSPKR